MNIIIKPINTTKLSFKSSTKDDLTKLHDYSKFQTRKNVVNSSFLMEKYNRALASINSRKAAKLENKARDLSEIFSCLDEYRVNFEGNQNISKENIEDFLEKMSFFKDSLETLTLIDVNNIGTDENGFVLFPQSTFGFEAKGFLEKRNPSFCHDNHQTSGLNKINMIIGKETKNKDGSFIASDFLDFKNGEYLKNVEIASYSQNIYAQQAVAFQSQSKGVMGNLADIMGGPVLVNGLTIAFGKLYADSIVVFDIDENQNIVGISTYEDVEINGLKFNNKAANVSSEFTLKAKTLCDTSVSCDKLSDIIYYKNYSSKGDGYNLTESADFALELDLAEDNLAFANLDWNRATINNVTDSRIKEPVRI